MGRGLTHLEALTCGWMVLMMVVVPGVGVTGGLGVSEWLRDDLGVSGQVQGNLGRGLTHR